MRLVLTIAMSLCGCPVLAGTAHDLMAQRSERDQRALLAAAVRSAGERCGVARHSLYLGESSTGDAGIWTAGCDSGDYIVSISNRGAMQSRVLPCGMARALGAACWQPFGR